MSNEKIILEIKSIGFTEFTPLRDDQRDGKNRFTWTHPIGELKDWFTVILLEEKNYFKIERLDNPLSETFDEKDVEGLIKYMKEKILKNLPETET